jgi:hypothetical protein
LCHPTPEESCVFLAKSHLPSSSQEFPKEGHEQATIRIGALTWEIVPFGQGYPLRQLAKAALLLHRAGLGEKEAPIILNFLQKFAFLKTYKMPSIFCAFNSTEPGQGAESKTSTSFIPMLKQAMIQCGSFSRNNGAMIRPFRAKGNGANGMS